MLVILSLGKKVSAVARLLIMKVFQRLNEFECRFQDFKKMKDDICVFSVILHAEAPRRLHIEVNQMKN